MASKPGLGVYSGDGRTISERNVARPLFEKLPEQDDPRGYLPEPALVDAVNVALALGQPLLVTGEPGTGKTSLAGSVAQQLETSIVKFQTKTSSTDEELFYRYDALGHFHASRFEQEHPKVENYITYEALGLAVLLSLPSEQGNPYLPSKLQGKGPTRAVVLVDEIDKAPRDFSNDILGEVETMSFTVKQTGATFTAVDKHRPILIMTSNSEKSLPDAFLRRCVFYHIDFPGGDRLFDIVRQRLAASKKMADETLKLAIQRFEDIRELDLRKKPATAELLAWIRLLITGGIDLNSNDPENVRKITASYSTLAKTKEDRTLIVDTYQA